MAKEISDKAIQLAKDSLTGDVTQFLIDHIRQLEVAYRYMNEDMQKEVIETATNAAAHLVDEVVRVIASDGRDSIPVQVGAVQNTGKKIKVVVEANKQDSHRHALFDAAGCQGQLVVADTEKYKGGEAPKPDPKQKELKISGPGEAPKNG